MATTTKLWGSGSGSVTITYGGSGNGNVSVVSDANTIYEQRSMDITIQTTAGSPQQTKTITISQAAKLRIDISTAVVTCANQTYSGSALTPTPTVTLNGETVPSTGYDVTYSNNTNAGTATITVTGKGDYTGSASGSFTIAQATGQVTTAPTANTLTYSGSAQYLVTAGSGTGKMYYRYRYKSYTASSWGSSWGSWSSFSTTRPSRTNAGYYEVEYYAAASSDGNFTQSATGTVSDIVMAKATRTISFTTKPTSVDVYGTVTVTANPSISSGTVTYTSSDTSIATVSGNVVTGVAEGSAIITASVPETNNCYSATASYTLGVVMNYAKEYLTIESLEDSNAIGWLLSSADAEAKTIYWSTNKQTWTAVAATTSGTTITILNKGDKIYIKGQNEAYGASSGMNRFTTSAEYVISGNIMSLIFENSFVGKTFTSGSYQFGFLLRETKVVSAENLILPSNVATYCYQYMFYNCVYLRVAPKLPATTLAAYCYRSMFNGCSNLAKAPKLPATTLVTYCYYMMFYYCTKLDYVWCLATSINASNCTTNWLYSVAATGKFLKPKDVSWGSGQSAVPSGWTKYNDRRDFKYVEYIQSSGTQYINLGVYGTEKHGIDMKFQFPSLSSTAGTGRLFGTRTGSNAVGAFGYVNTTTGNTGSSSKFYLGSNNGLSNTIAIDVNQHVVEMNKDNGKKIYFDGSLVATGNSTAFNNTAEAGLFKVTASGTTYTGGVAKVYYLKIYYSGVLILDLVPARSDDSDSIGYMYDQISDVLYMNDGTGNFVVGDDV